MWIETFMFGATLDSKICARSVSRQSLHIDYWTLISSKPMATTKRWWPPYNLLVGFMLIGGCEKAQPRDSNRDTLRFFLTLGSARIPGESQFISLYTDTSVLVDVTDNPCAALPELCFTLPSGEILDFLMFDEINSPIPAEVAHDEWAGIYATVRLQTIDNQALYSACDAISAFLSDSQNNLLMILETP